MRTDRNEIGRLASGLNRSLEQHLAFGDARLQLTRQGLETTWIAQQGSRLLAHDLVTGLGCTFGQRGDAGVQLISASDS